MSNLRDISERSDGLDRRKLLGTGLGAGTALALGSVGSIAMSEEPMLDLANMTDGDGLVHMSARTISPPLTISKQARAYLARMANRPVPVQPAASDKAAWRQHVIEHDAAIFPPSLPDVLPGVRVKVRQIGEATVYVVERLGQSVSERSKIHLYAHGGGWVYLAGKPCSILTQLIALAYGGTVFGVDYRTPPDHPFPAAIEDCLSCYAELLVNHRPDSILVSGSSAGSNLVAGMLHAARAKGLPMPCGLFLDTPPVDLTAKGDTITTNVGVDVLLKRWSDTSVRLYLDGADPLQPFASPLFGKLDDFPPTYLRSGTRDLLLSDTVRMHTALREAGVEADLFVHEAMPHGGFGLNSPEDKVCVADTQRWLSKHWKSGK